MKNTYALKLHRDVEKQLQRIPRNHRERLIQTMRSLREDPRPPVCIKLDNILHRVRQGQYRIIYAIFAQEVVVVICKVAKRDEETYKNLQSLLERAQNVIGHNKA